MIELLNIQLGEMTRLETTIESELVDLVKLYQANTALYALKMGQALKALKELQPNRKWSAYVETNFTFKTRTADRLIQGFNLALERGLISLEEEEIITEVEAVPSTTALLNNSIDTLIPSYFEELKEKYDLQFKVDGELTKKSLKDTLEKELINFSEYLQGAIEYKGVLKLLAEELEARENYNKDMEQIEKALSMLPEYMTDARDYIFESVHSPSNYWHDEMGGELWCTIEEIRA
ncbi:MAG: hypothetical protein DRJ64_09770 [Thermoprotei archaeon]|nr:MAG: hypothetical protein DRJ64_09770 [Thermoprotei archaeon]